MKEVSNIMKVTTQKQDYIRKRLAHFIMKHEE
jgi:hypothetical protein